MWPLVSLWIRRGSYGIQGEAGEFVRKIKGSFLNVVGFPLERFESLLLEHGIDVERLEVAGE